MVDTNGSDNLWLSLLNSVSSVKKAPLKHLLLLGGGNKSAKEWITSLNLIVSFYDGQKISKKNKGFETPSTCLIDYGYIEWMDPDHGERLAVIEAYLIPEYHSICETMLLELFTLDFLKNCLVCILLDWTTPWKWLRELHIWIQLLRKVLGNLRSSSEATDQVVLELIKMWEYKIRTYCENVSWAPLCASFDDHVAIPLEMGQYDEPLGLPLICVCNHSEYIMSIEKDELLKDEHFDFIQQFLRTILMKHGGALCYTSDLYQHTLNNLLYSILDGFSLSPQTYMDLNSPLKANVIDKDQIFVPVGWDSWGKIRAIQNDFNVERIAKAWELDLNFGVDKTEPGAVEIFEEVILDYRKNNAFNVSETEKLVTTMSLQEFLSNQLNIIETKVQTQTQESVTKNKMNFVDTCMTPTQLNLRGMKMDTDEVVERLQKLRDIRSESNSPTLALDKSYDSVSKTASPLHIKDQNEALANFFQSLLNRKKAQN